MSVNGFVGPVEHFEPLSNDDSGDEGGSAAAGAARLCSTLGVADVSCDNTEWVFAPAEVPTAWATAPAWLAVPAGLVFCGGGSNGVTAAALADWPARFQATPQRDELQH